MIRTVTIDHSVSQKLCNLVCVQVLFWLNPEVYQYLKGKRKILPGPGSSPYSLCEDETPQLLWAAQSNGWSLWGSWIYSRCRSCALSFQMTGCWISESLETSGNIWKQMCIPLLHRQITYVCAWINMYKYVSCTCWICIVLYTLQVIIRLYTVRSDKLLRCILSIGFIFIYFF